MLNFFSDFWKILRVDGATISKIRDDKLGFLIALRLFLVVTLFMTLGGFISALASEPAGIGSNLEQFSNRLDQLADRLPSFLSSNITQLQATIDGAVESLQQYQPPLGKDISYFLRSFGKWLSSPLALLGGWLTAALAVYIVARIFKGKGELREHVSVFLLGIAPLFLMIVYGLSHFSATLGSLGLLLNFAAYVWSFFILIAAIRIAHGFGNGKAFLTLLSTFVVFVVVIPAMLMLLSSFIISLIF
jgi:Yip1 domain